MPTQRRVPGAASTRLDLLGSLSMSFGPDLALPQPVSPARGHSGSLQTQLCRLDRSIRTTWRITNSPRHGSSEPRSPPTTGSGLTGVAINTENLLWDWQLNVSRTKGKITEMGDPIIFGLSGDSQRLQRRQHVLGVGETPTQEPAQESALTLNEQLTVDPNLGVPVHAWVGRRARREEQRNP